MSKRKLLAFVAISVAASLLISYFSKPMPFDDRLIHIQVERQLAPIDPAILNEPLDIQALLLDYSGDRTLVLKAWIALSKYPAQSRTIMRLYGLEPEFQEVLRHYGEAVIPVIQYFLDNDVLTLRASVAIQEGIDAISDMANSAWNRAQGSEPPSPKAEAAHKEIGPSERGWHAIIFVQSEGYKFLDQFDVDADTQVRWNQTSRIVSGVSSFFSSGLVNLEKKYDLHDEVKIEDVFFAGIDFLPLAASLKLLRAGRMAATSGKELGLISRTRIFATRLIPRSLLFQKFGKYAAVAATVYVVATHPSLINSIFAEAAKLMGLDSQLLQFVGWAMLITVLLYPFAWFLKGLASLVLLGFTWLGKPRKKAIYY